ncbi:MAG: hypothetical protein KAI67_04825 [Candidatus Pacebacteria bacterium]|nr:hypothetical protein [Candidatus Paceibacterota bacterium]
MSQNKKLNRSAVFVLNALATTFLVVVIYMAINSIGINLINSEHGPVTRALLILIVYMGSYFTLSRLKIFEKIYRPINVELS